MIIGSFEIWLFVLVHAFLIGGAVIGQFLANKFGVFIWKEME